MDFVIVSNRITLEGLVCDQPNAKRVHNPSEAYQDLSEEPYYKEHLGPCTIQPCKREMTRRWLIGNALCARPSRVINLYHDCGWLQNDYDGWSAKSLERHFLSSLLGWNRGDRVLNRPSPAVVKYIIFLRRQANLRFLTLIFSRREWHCSGGRQAHNVILIHLSVPSYVTYRIGISC